MTKNELVKKLEGQISKLKKGEEEIQSIRLWCFREKEQKLIGDSLIRVERKSFSWGCCKSETCFHNSHDPYTEGDTIFFQGRKIGIDEENRTIFLLHNGKIIFYSIKDNGQHYTVDYILEEGLK